ncbi:hypothetical protein [Demequina sp. SO4-18]|uniref:phage tail tube protein n=1 Tax=Demequina sp. SO4-18 TaxID=3401026 RepID=UPI003B5CF46D
MTQFIKDGNERVVVFDTRPADPAAITVTEWSGATDHSGAIVKPLDIDFDDPATFAFAVINALGNGQRPGKDNWHANVRIARDFDPGTQQPDATSDFEIALDTFGAKGETIRVGVYRGPKIVTDGALEAGDEYDYFEIIGGRAKSVADEETYIAKDVTCLPGDYAVSRGVLVSGV